MSYPCSSHEAMQPFVTWEAWLLMVTKGAALSTHEWRPKTRVWSPLLSHTASTTLSRGTYLSAGTDHIIKVTNKLSIDSTSHYVVDETITFWPQIALPKPPSRHSSHTKCEPAFWEHGFPASRRDVIFILEEVSTWQQSFHRLETRLFCSCDGPSRPRQWTR